MKVKKSTIRAEIEKNCKSFSTCLPHPDEIDSNKVKIPELLDTFLKFLLTKTFPVSKRVQRLTKSLGQDLIYNSTHGAIKTVKHLQLGIVTKRKTGSKFLINCLNKLGHTISYDEVSNVETSFAELQANHQSHHSFVPTNLQPSTFVTFVYDNCDHNPETITGVSMHCTNGIIIQNTNINNMR